MIQTLLILAISAVFFAVGKVRSDLVAICALVALLLCGILTPQEALSGFSNQVVIMMVGLFVVGGGIFQTGLAKMIGGRIMQLAGNNETVVFLLVMIVTAVIGAFVSNTGTVALMMPIVVSLSTKADVKARRLLMPLAFASSMGGMLTLIGTPPNLVIQETLIDAGLSPLSFFSFLPVGLVCIIVGIVVLLPLSKWMLSQGGTVGNNNKTKSLNQLADEYKLSENLSRLVVEDNSKAIGKTISELQIYNVYGLTVIEIRRDSAGRKNILRHMEQKLAGPNTALERGDTIIVSGDRQQVKRLEREQGLKNLKFHRDGKNSQSEALAFYDIGIAELLLMPKSRFIGRLVRESGFREKYNINIMGVRRGGKHLTENLADLTFLSGDILLVQGTWDNIARLEREEDDWVVMGQPLEKAAQVTLDYKAPIAAAIMIAMIAMMVFDVIPVAPVTAVMIAAILMVLTGCVRSVEAAYRTINWESIVLIAAMLPMSVALEKTGVSDSVSQILVSRLGMYGPMAMLAGIYFTTSLLTMFISNTATAVLMSPIALSSAQSLSVSPYPFLFAVTLGASMCFASPFSTPPNALVMQAGNYRFMDYVRIGLPLQIIIGIVMTFVLPLLYPF